MRIIAGIALIAFATGAPLSLSISTASAQSRDGASPPSRPAQDAPATDCDTYAASDSDPQRKAAGVPLLNVNPALAIPACQSAVQRYPNSSRLIFQLGRAYYTNNDLSSALAQYRKAANQGHAIAQYNLAVMYERAEGVPQNYAAALDWYRKAAEQGYLAAQSNLGGVYLQGHGLPQNYAEAMNWFRRAAERGFAPAQMKIGGMYFLGQGVPKNDAEAAKWFRRAADQNDALSQNLLGLMYASGQGVSRDYAEAAKWYRKAADQGNAEAQVSLGAMYGKGLGLPQNLAEAEEWTRKAAEQGDANAQANLGVMYENGQGVPPDHGEAVKWWRKAADQGNAEGIAALAEDQREERAQLKRADRSAVAPMAVRPNPAPVAPNPPMPKGSADPYADAYANARRTHYEQTREAYFGFLRNLFFAAGCKVVTADALVALISAEYDVVVREAVASGLFPDKKLLSIDVQAFRRDGVARASGASACDYWHQHPEAVFAVRKAAEGAIYRTSR